MAEDDAQFREWYRRQASRLGLSPDPDDPRHFYDWRAAWRSGATADASGHWPSQFKRDGHPNLIVDGVDTRTGKPAAANNDPIVDFYNQQKQQRSVADSARARLAARKVNPDVPVDPDAARERAMSPWERALLAASDAVKGDPKGAPPNDPALAFSPYVGLVDPSRRPSLPKLPVDPAELSPYAMMGDPPPPDPATVRARAAADLSKRGRTSEQGKAYVPGVSELTFRGISPYQDYYHPEQVTDIIKSIPGRILGSESRFDPADTDGDHPQLEDAWRMYLGLPQENNSFGISEYAPSRSKGTVPYYYKVNDFLKMVGDWRGINPNDVLMRLVWAAENPDRSQFDRKHPVLGTYQLNTGQDDRGRYLSYYDTWDLAPHFNGSPMNLDGILGKPFEIYDRIYYNPETFEPISPARQR